MDNFSLVAYSPAFNAENTASELLERMKKASRLLKRQGITLDAFIIVNDGSHDGTGRLLESASRETGFLKVVHKEKNEGAAKAVFSGMDAAMEYLMKKKLPLKKTIVLRMDSDLEHQPEDLPEIVRIIAEGTADVSVGYVLLDSRNGLVFSKFNQWAGLSESRRFLGMDIPLFCPGLYAARGDAFVKIRKRLLEAESEFVRMHKSEMVTLDFVFLAIAKEQGFRISASRLSPIEDRWVKRQPLSKLLNYLNCHFKTERFLERFLKK